MLSPYSRAGFCTFYRFVSSPILIVLCVNLDGLCVYRILNAEMGEAGQHRPQSLGEFQEII